MVEARLARTRFCQSGLDLTGRRRRRVRVRWREFRIEALLVVVQGCENTGLSVVCSFCRRKEAKVGRDVPAATASSLPSKALTSLTPSWSTGPLACLLAPLAVVVVVALFSSRPLNAPMSHHLPNAPRNHTPASSASDSDGSAIQWCLFVCRPAVLAVDDDEVEVGCWEEEASAGTATMEKRPNEWNA